AVTPGVVFANGTVGNGTPGSCTEAAFDAALAGGGTVTFDCGPDPVTIQLTVVKDFATSTTTTIDGGGKITLARSGTLFRLNHPLEALNLANITLSGNSQPQPIGGEAIEVHPGTLTLDHVIIRDGSLGIFNISG